MGATKLMTAAGGGITLDAASTATDKTITVPAVTDTMLTRTTNVNSGTAVASTSGTSIDFTSIPSWVKRITVMFSGVSTNGSAPLLLQIGSGSVSTTGYVSQSGYISGTSPVGSVASTTGIVTIANGTSSGTIYGTIVVSNISGNTWVSSMSMGQYTSNVVMFGGGSISLSGALDRVRIATTSTDTFDAGSINILYE